MHIIYIYIYIYIYIQLYASINEMASCICISIFYTDLHYVHVSLYTHKLTLPYIYIQLYMHAYRDRQTGIAITLWRVVRWWVTLPFEKLQCKA